MNPIISVCVITYNHEKYLAQCLDNILSQRCQVPFEIIIGEDKSTDSTPAIVEEYNRRHPGIIRVITTAGNVGMVANWRRVIQASKADYVAIIEGDDFWTDNNKLQRQFELMEANRQYALCFHDVNVIFGNNVPQIDSLNRVADKTEFDITDVITLNWFIPTCSMFIRRQGLADFPEWTKPLKAIDLVVQLLAVSNGKAFYIAEKMATYRIHEYGQSQVQWLGRENTFELTLITIFKNFNTYSKGIHSTAINNRLERSYRALMAKNPPKSKLYINAMKDLILLNPSANMPLFKGWVIVNLIPKSIYKLYRRIK